MDSVSTVELQAGRLILTFALGGILRLVMDYVLLLTSNLYYSVFVRDINRITSVLHSVAVV